MWALVEEVQGQRSLGRTTRKEFRVRGLGVQGFGGLDACAGSGLTESSQVEGRVRHGEGLFRALGL